MVAFIQKTHGCIFLYDAIKAQAAQLAISDRRGSLSGSTRCRSGCARRRCGKSSAASIAWRCLSRHCHCIRRHCCCCHRRCCHCRWRCCHRRHRLRAQRPLRGVGAGAGPDHASGRRPGCSAHQPRRLPIGTICGHRERPQQCRYRAAVAVAEVFLDPPIVVVAAAAIALVVIVGVVLLVGGAPTPPPPRSLSPVATSSTAVAFHSSASTFA